MAHVLAIDQGTTSTRAIVFDDQHRIAGLSQQEIAQHYPASGWVEHDAEEIWRSVISTVRGAIQNARLQPTDIAAVGITNQRETTVIWERGTGRPIHRAIVWQDRRTAARCTALRGEGLEADITAKTGLVLDPYFSATKIGWLLDNVDGAHEAARRGELAFGTIESFLLWRLTGGRKHLTDATNACRTMLYNIELGAWDKELLDVFGVPHTLLPEIVSNAGAFGATEPAHFGAAIPITGLAGDQQAATVGQACFEPGMMKSTYGTGCFALVNTGPEPVRSTNRLLTTVAYQLDGTRTFALEGAIFVAGAAVQWLRDGLGIIERADQSGELAARADASQRVILVPAFTGLGAPYWDAECRGALFGLTRDTGPAEFAAAALESVCFQTRDLADAMHRDMAAAGIASDTVLRVDGGMVASDWTMQRLADLLATPVDRPRILETTALGAAYLAGMHAGVYPAPAEFAASWTAERRFEPVMDQSELSDRYDGWHDAVRRTLSR